MGRTLAIFLVAWICAAPAWGEVFLLNPRGEVRGALLNPEQTPRTSYKIRTSTGGEVTLKASQVKQVVKQTQQEMDYDRLRPKAADTAGDQWKLAEWCLANKLPKHRKTHLERVIALDPDHADARRALGYFKKQGRWLTQDIEKTEQGFVKFEGKWKLPQEIELIQKRRAVETAEKGWVINLKRWRGLLGSNKKDSDDARERIAAIDDPHAAKALIQGLQEESDRDTRLLFVEALARINSPGAMDALVARALSDGDEEVRLAALEEIVTRKYRPALAQFVAGLKSKDNIIVNRAGLAFEHLGDLDAVSPLIDALWTEHKYKIVKGQPGQMSSTFGTGGAGGGNGGFSFGGGGTQIIKRKLQNKDVLHALVHLSSANFDFDVEAWKSWYASSRKSHELDARRD